MITLVQRVLAARVLVDEECVGAVERGMLLFVGVEQGDSELDADATAKKIAAMRIFPGRTPTDQSVLDVDGGCLVVSQFTLAAELKGGHRPDFTAAAPAALADALYQRLTAQMRMLGVRTATGRFGASMRVEITNDGPFSLVLTVRGGKVVPRSTLPSLP